MYKHIKNDNGSTLLIALLIIVMFSLLSVTFIAANLNQTKQVQKSDQLILSTNLAEMGIIHLKKEIYDYIKTTPSLTADNLVLWVTDNYSNSIEVIIPPGSTSGTYKYIIRNVGAIKDSATSNVTITFDSVGIIDNKEGKVILGRIMKSFDTSGGPVGGGDTWEPPDDDGDGEPDWNTDDDLANDPGSDTDGNPNTYEGNYRFTDTVNVDTDKTVNGDAKFEGDLTFNNQDSTVTVTEDAFFEGVVGMEAQSSNIIVQGNASFSNQVNFEGTNSSISIGTATQPSDAIFSGPLSMIANFSDMIIYGSATFNTIFISNNHSVIDVRKDAQFNGDVTIDAGNDGWLTVGCSAVFEKTLTSIKKNIITIKDDGTFKGLVTMRDSKDARLQIGRNAVFQSGATVNHGVLTINGHAAFGQIPVIDSKNAQIIVKGNLYMNGTTMPEGLQVNGMRFQYSQYSGPINGSFTCSAPDSGIGDDTTY